MRMTRDGSEQCFCHGHAIGIQPDVKAVQYADGSSEPAKPSTTMLVSHLTDTVHKFGIDSLVLGQCEHEREPDACLMVGSLAENSVDL